jgi:superfamily I DNA/RNA helicase
LTDHIDLLAIDRGSVIAPAGCGKTQHIVEAIAKHSDSKPILVLTHTNAGVAALRARLQRARVPASRYRVSTIDGFALFLVKSFPKRSGIGSDSPALSSSKLNYAVIRQHATVLLESAHIKQMLGASYSRVFVDEYQDCVLPQHRIVSQLANHFPCVVLGDPLQAIFEICMWRYRVVLSKSLFVQNIQYSGQNDLLSCKHTPLH